MRQLTSRPKLGFLATLAIVAIAFAIVLGGVTHSAAPAASASAPNAMAVQQLPTAAPASASSSQTASTAKSSVVPDVQSMVGPVSQNLDLRKLPKIAPSRPSFLGTLMRHRFGTPGSAATSGHRAPQKGQSGSGAQTGKSASDTDQTGAPRPRQHQPSGSGSGSQTPAASSSMPSPTGTFAGVNSALSGCGCTPPDTTGDVGPNNYIQSVNSSIRIYDKSGNVLTGAISYNSFFSAMGTATPCGNNLNDGDGIVMYDHTHDRWIVSDFAFPAGTTNGAGPTYQCIGVSKTSDPVAGGWYLYAVQIDSANPTWLGDYPKFGIWNDGLYFSVNLFVNSNVPANETFQGVKVFALDLNSMVNGGSSNSIGFEIAPADLGDQYSLVPATFRTGTPPPAGQPEWFMDVNSSTTAGTVENQIFVRRFHADFTTPANSTFGVGATHAPDGTIGVNGFVDGFNGTAGTDIVPNGTSTTTQYLDTLGDKLMFPLVYQNLNGVESIYADQTICQACTSGSGSGPTAIRWYQLNVTGNSIPATPTQQQDFNGGGDGLYRYQPALNVDNQGDLSIIYSASSTTVDPGIRYAGRLATDPANTLGQGEAVMTAGTGHQTSTGHRWGDYSGLFVDPNNGCTFYGTHEYYAATATASWNTRVGMWRFPGCTNASVTGSSSPTTTGCTYPSLGSAPASAGPVTVTATLGTTGPTDYATLQAAFAAINAGTHKGDITVWLLGNTTETAAAVLNASGSGSASYTTVQVVPSGARTVTGNLATPLVDLNGAKCVKIDGLNSGGNSLTLSNTSTSSTAGTSTVRFINGAQNDTLTRSTILGSSTVALGAAGGAVLFSTATASGTNLVGNSSDTVSNNNIGPAGANLPIKAITMLGTAGNNTVNRDDVIDSNNVFDFFSATASNAGIDIRAGNQTFTVSNNRIYQTASRTFTGAALRYSGILFSGTTAATGNYGTISGNTIGFGASNGTGTTTISGNDNEFRGIDLQGSNSLTSTRVQGNTISGIVQTSSRNSTTSGLSAFAGIQAATSAGASATGLFDILGNTVGSLDGSSTIVVNASSTTANTASVFAILALSGGGNTITGNSIGAITVQGTGTVTGLRGIVATAATTGQSPFVITNNAIGGSNAGGALTDTLSGNYAVYGIQTGAGAVTITGNTIRNLNGSANVAGTVVSGGIVVANSQNVAFPNTISGNTISGLSDNGGSAAVSIYAMDLTMPVASAVNANLIEKNVIHSLSLTSTDNTSQTWGIVLRGPATAGNVANSTVQNNVIRLGLDASGNSVTSGLSIIGIRDIAATNGTTANSYYNNSVYIGGSGVASSSNTFAFNSGTITTTRNFKNNIFVNARSNASGAGKNYAITVGGTTVNPGGLTSNFNDLYVSGTGGVLGVYNAVDQATLANWRTATGLDASSISADPLFVNPTGTSSTFNLHIGNTSPARVAGTAVATTTAAPLTGVTDDIDSDARPASTPDIGADQTPQTATSLSAGSASGTYGGTVTLTATLTSTSGGNAVAGKTIAFTLNGSSVGNATTNASGVATLNNASLAGINAGSYPSGVGASFAGDAGYSASNSTASLTVAQANQAIVISTHAPSSAAVDDQFTVAATGGGSGNAVAYGSSGSCTNAGATYTITSTGTCTVTYDQAGNANYNAAPQLTESVNSSKANQTIHVTTHAPASAAYGSQFTVAATGGNSGNPVVYGSSGSCSNSGATFTITSGSGTCTVTYDQDGSANYNAASQVVETVTATKLDQTITVNTAAPSSAAYNASFDVAASAPGGTVSYSSTGVCTNAGSHFTMTSGTGTCHVLFDQAGSSTYNAAPQVDESVTATKLDQSITFAAIGSHTYGDPDFDAGATASSGNAASYSASGNCSIVGGLVHITGAGSCTVTAGQGGDANYNAASPVDRTFSIAKADQVISIGTHAPSSAVYGSGFTVAATGGGTGNAVTYGSSGGCSNTGADFSMTSGSTDCVVTYDEAGDANYNAAPQKTETVTAQKADQTITITTHAPATAVYGTSFTVAATSSSGKVVHTGSSEQCDNGTGNNEFTMTSGTGECVVTYDQAGDANYNAAPQKTDTVTAQKADQTITVTTHAPAAAVYGTGFTVAATSSSGNAVAYSSAGGCSNTGADFTITSGTTDCVVKYNQAGDDNYNAASQQTESVSVSKADQSIHVGIHAPSSAAYGSGFTVAATGGGSGNAVTYGSSGGCTNTGADFSMTSGGTDCVVTYDQAGDANYNAAPQVSETVTAQKANQSIHVGTHAPSSAAYGSGFTVAATGGCSGNAVTYGSSGGCTNTGADFTMTSGSTDCVVTYDQAGDADHNAASQVSETVTATKADQSIHVGTHAPSSAAYGSGFTVAATGGSSGNAVTFGSSGACSNVGATYTMTSGTGTCTVTYNQAGNGNYNAAPQQSEAVTATKAGQTITVTTHAPSSAVNGSSFTVAATAPSGTVSYSSSGACTNSGATVTMTSSTGTCTVLYNRAGDANYNAAPQVTETVTATSPAANNPSIVGLSGVKVATITGSKIDSFDSSLGVYGSSNHGSSVIVISNSLLALSGVFLSGDATSTQGAVTVASSSTVTGNVTAGTTASVSGHVGGYVKQNSPSTPVAKPTVTACSPYSSVSGASGGKSTYSATTGDLVIKSGSVKLAAATYCFHNVTVARGATLKVSGPVTIRLTGKLGGPGHIANTTNLPGNLRIESSFSGLSGVVVTGNSHAAMKILAPDTKVTIKGGSYFGTVFADTVKLAGQLAFHGDTH